MKYNGLSIVEKQRPLPNGDKPIISFYHLKTAMAKTF